MIELDLPDIVPVVRADTERLEQVLVKLLQDARKYPPAGTAVSMRLSVRDDAVAIAVTDRGVGVPLDDHARISERLHRRGTIDSNITGLGLGPYIASQIITAHRGALTVKSAPGARTTFTATIPRDDARPDE